MKKLFEKIANAKGLPINLIGTSLLELLLFILIVISLSSFVALVWSTSTALFLWLLILSIYIFIHSKKSSMIWERLDEVDQRDMDFKDEFDRKITKFLDNPP